MAATDWTVGYPVHAVADYAISRTAHGVTLTDWKAACGATGQAVGTDPFGSSGSARRAELCRACWPAGHATYHRRPTQTA